MSQVQLEPGATNVYNEFFDFADTAATAAWSLSMQSRLYNVKEWN